VLEASYDTALSLLRRERDRLDRLTAALLQAESLDTDAAYTIARRRTSEDGVGVLTRRSPAPGAGRSRRTARAASTHGRWTDPHRTRAGRPRTDRLRLALA
jgi:hypothetical protein